MMRMVKNHCGSLLLITGTSSSGKSSIVTAFCKKNPSVSVFNIDDWFPQEMVAKAKQLGWQADSGVDPWLYLIDYVDRKAGTSNVSTEVRTYLFQEVPTMYIKAKEALRKGNTVIIDTVFEYDSEYNEFNVFFTGFNCFKLLVYCPLDILLERVLTRNKKGIKEEARSAFQAFEQFPALFKVQENVGQAVIDTIATSVIKNSLQSAIQALIDDNISDKYIPRIKLFERAFIERFRLDRCDSIALVPRHQYDLILNSVELSPEELAEKLMMYLKKV